MATTAAISLLAGFVATGCGSDDQSSDSAAAGQATSPGKSGVTRSYKSFQLPSKNIACAMDDGAYARCEVQKKTFTPPAKPANCPLDWGSAVEVEGKRRGAFLCHGDTVMNPGAPVLRYGDRSVVGPIRCASSTAGVKCRNTKTGHGFFLAREKFRTF